LSLSLPEQVVIDAKQGQSEGDEEQAPEEVAEFEIEEAADHEHSQPQHAVIELIKPVGLDSLAQEIEPGDDEQRVGEQRAGFR